VLAIGCDRRVPTAAGLVRADRLAAGLPRRAWQRLSAGAGAKGERFYDWASITHPDPAGPADRGDGQCWWQLIRRHRHTGELAFYRCYSLKVVPLRELVRVAAHRPTVEESFQAGTGGWPASTSTRSGAEAPGGGGRCARCSLTPCWPSSPRTNTPTDPAPAGPIALTCNENHRLLVVHIIEPARTITCPDAWSDWRRRHQHRAMTSHYRRQNAHYGWT